MLGIASFVAVGDFATWGGVSLLASCSFRGKSKNVFNVVAQIHPGHLEEYFEKLIEVFTHVYRITQSYIELKRIDPMLCLKLCRVEF